MPSDRRNSFPTVSCILNNYNSAHLLRRAMESVLAQTVPPSEILVVDDASQEDNVEEVVHSFGDRVRLIRRTINGGLSVARNDGTRAAQGEWVAYLDADDRWLPNKLERQLETAAAHPEAAVIYSDCIQTTPEGKRLPDYHADKKPKSGKILDALIEEIFVLPSSMMIRRATLLEAGGFNERLRGAEDWDLCLRLSLAGVAFQLVPELLVYYERQPNSLSRNHAKMLHYQAMALAPLLQAELTAGQRARMKRRLSAIHFELGYLLRPLDLRGSVRHAAMAVRYRPDQLLHWKLLVGNSLRTALARA